MLAWVELGLDPDRFALTVADERLTVRRGAVDEPDAVLHTDAGTLRELALNGRALDEMIAAGRATVTGNRRAAARVLGCFAPPPPTPRLEPGGRVRQR